jgi:sugar phosphate isomerase/epimerase
MRISIASYAFHGLLAEGKMDVFGYLESCRYRYGLDAADIWNGMLPTTDEAFVRKVREAMDEKEMVLANLCVDRAHVWDPDPEKRAALRENALAHLRAAVTLGAKTVRIDMGGRSPEMTDEQFDVTVAGFREYAEFAADHGFRTGPENHFGPALVADNQRRLKEAVDSPAYGVLLHVGHWAADAAEGDRLVAPWTIHTHVDANTCRTCVEERMRMLLDEGYGGHWGVEHHSARNEYSEVAWQLAVVRRALVGMRSAGQGASEG